ncbi:MAG: hypothetical protein IT307_15110, partial [Chloroflexi bacterium]|nr:hypothetical protein [Chloroflexota bacterium]
MLTDLLRRTALPLVALLVLGGPASPAPDPVAAQAAPADTPSAAPLSVVGQLGGSINALAVREPYVFLGVGPRLQVLDVSDPANPTLVAQSEPMPFPVQHISLDGHHAYVSGPAREVRMFDVSDPRVLVPVAVISTELPVADWDAQNGLLYIVEAEILDNRGFLGSVAESPQQTRLSIVDVAIPTQPRTLSNYTPDTGERLVHVAVEGKLAYAELHLRAGELVRWDVLDASDPGAPTRVSALSPEVPTGFGSLFAAAGNLVFAGASASDARGGPPGSLAIFSMADPAHPVKLTSIPTGWENGGITAMGDYLIRSAGSLRISSIAEPSAPMELGQLSLPWMHHLVAREGHIYAVGQQSLYVVDWTEPRHPAVSGRYQTIMASETPAVAASGTTVYVGQNDLSVDSDERVRLHVVDGTTPSRLHQTQAIPLFPGNGLVDVLTNGGRLYTLQRQYKAESPLELFDVSMPSQPSSLADSSVPGEGTDLARCGAHLCALGFGNLHVVDVSNPTQPVVIGSYRMPDTVGLQESGSIATAGQYVYVTTNRHWYIFDLADPTQPRVAATLGGAGRMDVSGDRAYLVSNRYLPVKSKYWANNDLQVYDVSDPLHPSLLATVPIEQPVSAFGSSGNIVYLA